MAGLRLQVDNLGVTFERRGGGVLQVLNRVSFSVEDGEFVALVGPSGCGKTTVLRCLGGLLKAAAGTITIGDHVLEGVDRDVAMVFQSDSLYPWRTVVGNIALGMEIRRQPASRVEPVVRDLVDLVGLSGFEQAFPHQLSGGMRQRVNLARALAVDPGVLLMDEPFSSLDMQTREYMQLELLRIWDRKKKTVVFVTHQIEEAVFLSDRVLLMSPRPGTIRMDVRVDIQRPRDVSVRRSAAFHAIVDALAEELGREAARAQAAVAD
jgi:NitT/TauT family transport system ATP-binding protein